MIKEKDIIRPEELLMSFLSKENAPGLLRNKILLTTAEQRVNDISDSGRGSLNKITGTILQNLLDDKWNQDQREAGLKILGFISERNRTPYFLSTQLDQYITILKQLNDESHPYEVVENLFDAGVILFAGLPLEEESRQSVITEMERTAGYFSDEEITYEGLYEKITELEKTRSGNAIPPRTSPKRKLPPQYALLPESQIRAMVPFSRRRTKLREEAA